VLLLAALSLVCIHSAAQVDYPAKAVRLIVPLPPGGGADYLARQLAKELSDQAGQTFYVENRGGAGGSIGAQQAASAAPDGYTLILGYIASHGINPALSKLPYDPVKNFTPVSLVASAPNMLIVHPSVPASSVKELIALAKSKPGQLHYGSGGNGSATHLSGELFNMMAGTDIVHVPYKGAGPALADLLAGHVQITFASMPAALPHGKANKVRMLALTSQKRALAMPELPTVSEAGLAGYSTEQWYGILGPAGMAETVVAKLHRHILAALKVNHFAEQVRVHGFELIGSTPAAFREHIEVEVAKWKKVVQQANIKPD
jgi:tripartite-type tricarboxylate transporter receptor subunit TctC